MDDQIRLAKISPRTIEFLFQGASACFPDVFYGANFQPEKQPVAQFWGAYDRTSFGELLTDVTYPFTKSRTIEEAVKKIKEWRRLLEDGKYPEATVPDKLNELVEEYEQRKEELAKNEDQRLNLAQEFKAVADKARETREAEEKQAPPPITPIKEPKIIPATRVELPTEEAAPVPATISPAESKEEIEKKEKPIFERPKFIPLKKVELSPEEKITPPSKKTLLKEQVFLKPAGPLKIPQIAPADIEEVKSLIETAKKNPTSFSENLAKKLVQEFQKAAPEAVPDDQIQLTSKLAALNFTDKLIGLDPNEDLFSQLSYLYSQNTIHVTASLADSTSQGFLESIPDGNQVRQIAEAGQGLSLILENDHVIAKTFLSPVFKNQAVLEIFYPGAENLINFDISAQQDDQTTHEVNLPAFQNSYQQALSDNSQVIDEIGQQTLGRVQEYGFKALDKAFANTPWYQKTRPFLARFVPGLGAKEIALSGSFFRSQPGLISLWTAKSVPLFTPNLTAVLNSSFANNILLTPVFNFQLGSFAVNRAVFTTTEGFTGQVLGINLGNFGVTLTKVATEKGTQFALNIGTKAAIEAASKTAGAAAVKAVATTAVSTAAKTGIKAALGTAFKAIVSSVGEIFGGPLGHLITWLATEGATRLVSGIWRWIKRHKEDFIIVPLALLSLGLVVGGAVGSLLIGGALITGIGYGAMMAGGIQPAGTLIAQGAQSFIFALTHVALPAIGVPVIIALISIPAAVALILFIINSGAYVVPPGALSQPPGPIVSPYIEVVKTPNDPGPFENSDLPLTIEYTVQIKAKKGTLSNIKIDSECSVLKKNNAPDCPKSDPEIPSGLTIPETISPTQPYSFTYRQTYTSPVFEDSLVTDIITVTADAPEQAGAQAAASASIIIGNPPDECPNGWPIMPEGQESSLAITQGPKGSYSHAVIEAIDVGASSGHIITARHSGMATYVETTGAYRPKYVDVQSVCNGVAFVSRYAHLTSSSVRTGDVVTLGQAIGTSGSDGTGPHLHYEFRTLNMAPPFIPKSVPYGCSDNCGAIP